MDMLRIVLIAIFGLVLQSCLSASSWQTAETLKSGEGRIIIAGGNYTSPSINESIQDAEEESGGALTVEEDELAVPFGEFAYRYGFTDSFEGGLKLTLPSGMTFDGKYNLIDADSFDFALGLAYATMSIESESTNSDGTKDKSKFTMSDIILPIYTSFRFGSFALYLVPKYLIRQTKSETADTSTNFTGGTVGLMIGQDWGMMVEATYLKQADSEFDIMQTGAAFFF